MHPKVTAVQDALESADAHDGGGAPSRIRMLPDAVHTAAAAADALEVQVGQHPKPVRTLVDMALSGYDEIWAAGGIPHAVFPTTYAELVRITSGTPAEVA
jgi:hypothetical protein